MRRRYDGDDGVWWSAKPPEYQDLKDLGPFFQIAGQVYYTDRAITKGLNEIPRENRLIIDYESLCEAPEKIYKKTAYKYAGLGYEMRRTYSGPERFECGNRSRLTKEEAERILASYHHFSGETIEV